MVFQLLKQIPGALGRFVVYRLGRAFGGNPAPLQPVPSEPASVARAGVTAGIASSSQPGRPPVDLDPRYLALTDWPTYQVEADLPELLADPLYQLWLTIPNGHKWSQYFAIYRKVFDARREKPMRILEIGVYLGSGLSLWREYFSHKETIVVGIDIQANCSQFAAPARGIEVRIGSQTDQAFLQRLIAEFGPFDIIIDDGSHHTAHQIESFNHLFDGGLKTGGVYLVEDLHASYWPAWRDSEKTFLDICKELIELMHVHYHRDDLPQTFARHAPDQHASIRIPSITKMLGEIRIFDSIAAIEKVEREYLPHYVTREKPPIA